MLVVTIKELRELDSNQLKQKLQETNEALFKVKFQIMTHQSSNTAEIGRLKNQLAQLKMLLVQSASHSGKS
jgi:ribosomal protein L29